MVVSKHLKGRSHLHPRDMSWVDGQGDGSMSTPWRVRGLFETVSHSAFGKLDRYFMDIQIIRTHTQILRSCIHLSTRIETIECTVVIYPGLGIFGVFIMTFN